MARPPQWRRLPQVIQKEYGIEVAIPARGESFDLT